MKRVIAIASILCLAAVLCGMFKTGPNIHLAGLNMASTIAPAMFKAPSSLEHATPTTETTFQAIDLFIDSNNQPLAAYQLDFHATRGTIRIVGIEGGEHGAFNKAPYYDAKAIQNDHILLAAYSLADATSLPTSRSRIARIHLMIEGAEQPEYSLTLTAAGSPDAKHIEAKAEFVPATNDKSNEPDKGR